MIFQDLALDWKEELHVVAYTKVQHNSARDLKLQQISIILLCFQAPDHDKINCDNMKYFKIQYKEQDALRWKEELAANTVEQKNITTDIEFGTEYRVMVVAINNQDLSSSSAIHKITTMPNCEYCFTMDYTFFLTLIFYGVKAAVI